MPHKITIERDSGNVVLEDESDSSDYVSKQDLVNILENILNLSCKKCAKRIADYLNENEIGTD